MTTPASSTLRSLAVTIIAVAVLALALRVVDAGSLTPVAAPAATMNSLSDIYDALVGGSYDSSTMDVDIDGNAIEVARCVYARMTGGTCPGTPPSISLLAGLSVNLGPNGGASDCDGDGDLDDGCVTVGCTDFLLSVGGTYTSVTLTYGGESRTGATCAFSPTSAIATCGELGVLPVTVSVCNGAVCASDTVTLDAQDNSGPYCP